MSGHLRPSAKSREAMNSRSTRDIALYTSHDDISHQKTQRRKQKPTDYTPYQKPSNHRPNILALLPPLARLRLVGIMLHAQLDGGDAEAVELGLVVVA